jgi:anti-repressor protein
MIELQSFTYQTNEVRTVQRNGEPWFVLRDVCEVLCIGSPHKVYERLDEDEKGAESNSYPWRTSGNVSY